MGARISPGIRNAAWEQALLVTPEGKRYIVEGGDWREPEWSWLHNSGHVVLGQRKQALDPSASGRLERVSLNCFELAPMRVPGPAQSQNSPLK